MGCGSPAVYEKRTDDLRVPEVLKQKNQLNAGFKLVAGALLFMKSEPTTFGFPKFRDKKTS
ncbi:MAG: hypothetical protein B7X50_05315 [Alishewanella sp. 34-51-39]|nr:MAG: hypothetical protein B7X50_05315 [Alishewanella sp. 34-51-39]